MNFRKRSSDSRHLRVGVKSDPSVGLSPHGLQSVERVQGKTRPQITFGQGIIPLGITFGQETNFKDG